MYPELVKYSFYVLLHPFNGFWDIKYDNKGKVRISLAILLLLTIATILQRQFSGFVVNFNNPADLNSVNELKYIVLPFILWCVSNWSLTTLMDGEGKFREIITVTGYALLPLALVHLISTILSNMITLQESAFYYFLESFAFIWFIWLLFIGTMTVHQYTVLKTIVTMALTLLVMGIIMFLGLLFFSLMQQMLGFALSVYTELSLRM
ncbi:Yip1 family protein [Paenibacillus sp. LHD-117]|uniref:Yip1 family protein n=1 Tax=Paenibacillus sp. LHD-117 TaxID=3071412 RepID=UPI0027E20B58|nr:Yip1 family protein [Paenibacillus sp. LHD-117]MDQ6418421.1 Yip1 family protein [Paenibacillus sp. LHD-117]